VLRSLRLQGLGVINDAELQLAPGLNVITGETGAGKTMVVSGLGLLLGARADSGLVRTGAAQAVVEGEVDVASDHPAAARAAAAGGDVADGLILVRSLSAEGRSRAHVGGRAAPVGVLGEVGEHLVAVHGQADQWRLRDPEQHRRLLDVFGGPELATSLTAYGEAYAAWTRARTLLHELTTTGAERAREAQMLRVALEEIEAVDPQEGEEDALRAEEERLAHADGLRAAAAGAHAVLSGDDDATEQPGLPVVDLLSTVGHTLARVSEHDPELQALRTRADELGYLASDLAGDLASYTAGIDVDPARLAQVQQRRATLTSLLRSYGASTGEVLRWAADSAQRLAELDTSHDRVAQVAEEVQARRSDVAQRGMALRRLRTDAAARLGTLVTAELGHLAMGSAQVEVVVLPRTGGPGGAADDEVEVAGAVVRPRPHGLEDVEIRLAANPGAPARTVTRAASGGELSRVMLALELVCAQTQVPTYVFDEVDAGVGGSAALDLGARLARLAETAQVLVVTHLGQVAAYADRHLVVHKSSDGQVTSSGVRQVSGDERVSEIARMLGGVSDSAAALEHARALLHEHAPARARASATSASG
jgi:DNA repair protein RecN (Recombination protein N)